VDVFAQKGSYSVGIEVGNCSIRMNSIEKLNALKPVFGGGAGAVREILLK